MATASLTWTSNENSGQPIKRLSLRELFFAGCFLTIIYVSVLDTWFAVENPAIIKMEQNPVCEMLMQLDPQGFSWFVAGKFAGNLVCLSSICAMFRLRYQHAGKVLVGVALFQLGLLGWLVLSDPKMGGMPNLCLLFSETPESIWRLR